MRKGAGPCPTDLFARFSAYPCPCCGDGQHNAPRPKPRSTSLISAKPSSSLSRRLSDGNGSWGVVSEGTCFQIFQEAHCEARRCLHGLQQDIPASLGCSHRQKGSLGPRLLALWPVWARYLDHLRLVVFQARNFSPSALFEHSHIRLGHSPG